MHCLYINLAEQILRREALEASFAAHNQAGWVLHRLEAMDARQVEESGIEGNIKSTEKACFSSHLRAISGASLHEGPVMIMEDDVVFGKKTQSHIMKLLGEIGDASWDVIFTDLTITDIHTMIELFNLRHSVYANGEVGVLDLGKMPTFAGAVSYIINDRAKQKVLELMSDNPVLDLPFDIALRHSIWDRKISAYVTFPFVTSDSALAGVSLVQPGNKVVTEAVCRYFRKMIWAESSSSGIEEELASLDRIFVDRKYNDLSRLLRVALSPSFIYK